MHCEYIILSVITTNYVRRKDMISHTICRHKYSAHLDDVEHVVHAIGVVIQLIQLTPLENNTIQSERNKQAMRYYSMNYNSNRTFHHNIL